MKFGAHGDFLEQSMRPNFPSQRSVERPPSLLYNELCGQPEAKWLTSKITLKLYRARPEKNQAFVKQAFEMRAQPFMAKIGPFHENMQRYLANPCSGGYRLSLAGKRTFAGPRPSCPSWPRGCRGGT